MQHPIVNEMLPNVAEFLSNHPLYATDDASINEWKKSCEKSWSLLAKESFTNEETTYSSSIFSAFLNAYSDFARLVAEKKHSNTSHWTLSERLSTIERLLKVPQIEQRTEAWYLDAAGLLSASQFNCILKSGRTRGQIVLQKASSLPPDINQRRNCVLTEELNPFTWGIRFEPIIKMIYENLTDTTLADLGRLKHTDDPRLAASPDGLVIKGPEIRLARFVEFKAPVTRKILSIVPDDYMAQMQIQMEVGKVEECDYLEIKFNSLYPKGSQYIKKPENSTAKIYFGRLFLIKINDEENNETLRYEYGPLNDESWLPNTIKDEEIIEIIPWWTNEWFMTTVGRSRTWFESVKPSIQLFWEDVEKAKRGEFELPASSRKVKEPVCQIIDDVTPQENSCLIIENII
jgi:hypothetical protein